MGQVARVEIIFAEKVTDTSREIRLSLLYLRRPPAKVKDLPLDLSDPSLFRNDTTFLVHHR